VRDADRTVPAPTYRTDFSQHCRTHAIDGLTLAFHRPSGTTHFLASPMPEILAVLTEAPMDAAALCGKLCEQLELPYDEEALIVTEARLRDLVASGLVRAG
jgi:PqqD family protein of HPr-rel-A system